MKRLPYLLTVVLTILGLMLFNTISQAQTSFNISNQTTGDTLFTIDNEGKVGIGTTTPGATIEAKSDAVENATSLSLSNSDDSHYLYLYSGRDGSPGLSPVMIWQEGDPFRFASWGAQYNEYMRISEVGYVGIGTAFPTEMLEVADTIYSSIGGFKFPDGTVQETAASAGGAIAIDSLTDGRTTGLSVFLGSGAGINDDGSTNRNTATGYDALHTSTTGFNNTANGYNALYSANSGRDNVASGHSALYSNTTGGFNVGLGMSANRLNQTGSQNTIIGYEAGRGIALHNKSGNILLGYQAGYNETGDNKLYIENSNSAAPLIGGDFTLDEIYLNGKVGVNETTPTAELHVGGIDGVLFTGTYGSGTIPIEGEGSRIMWYPGKAALRAGRLASYGITFWDDDSIGENSIALGFNSVARGDHSLAHGPNTRAHGDLSVALGSSTRATGNSSTALGVGNIASGYGSLATGRNTIAGGSYATAMGYDTRATGTYSTALGTLTEANAYYSLASGNSSVASGSASTAMGWGTTASGQYSTSMGSGTVASGGESTAMGENSSAIGRWSVAIGYNSNASAVQSIAIGANCEATGDYSHSFGSSADATGNNSLALGAATTSSGLVSTAMGNVTTASGDYSTAMGFSTEAIGEYSTAMGYNSIVSGSEGSVAMGYETSVQGQASLAMGFRAYTRNSYSLAIGAFAGCKESFSIALGHHAKAHHNASIVFSANADIPLADSVYTGGDEQMVFRADGGVYFTNAGGAAPYNTARLINTSTGGYLSAGGTWTNASSRDYKENISELSTQQALNSFNQLTPVTYNYKVDSEEDCVGFIAEDVPDLVSTRDRKGLSPMDIVAVLTKVVQNQQHEIDLLKQQISQIQNNNK